jgi:hypothetical protein
MPKLIFANAYRYGLSLCRGPDFKTRIQVVSGPGVNANVVVEEYVWSIQKSEFVLDSRREYPPIKGNMVKKMQR